MLDFTSVALTVSKTAPTQSEMKECSQDQLSLRGQFSGSMRSD